MNEQNKKSMKRQLFTSVLCLLTLMLMLIGSTLAWFTDSAYTSNTMEAGKIDIEQTTSSWDNLVMMPTQTYTTEVVVKNTGNNPCYVRTLFAFEDTADSSVLKQLTLSNKNIVIPGMDPNLKEDKIQFTVTKQVNGEDVVTTYTVGFYVHEKALPVGQPMTALQTVTLLGTAGNDWSAAVGTHYEMHVLSQACQVAGMDGKTAGEALDIAFEKLSAENCAKWFKELIK